MELIKKIAIITDTNSGISPKEARELCIELLPMPFFINEEVYFEGVTLSQEEFYRAVADGSDVSTSQPTPASIIELWDKVLKDYDEIVHIPMSSGLSSSYATAKMIAEDYDGHVFVVDNKRISVTQRQSVLDAVHLRDAGHSASEIAAYLEETALDADIFLTVETLSYLKKGGRITPAAAALGTALNIIPVLQIKGDKLDAFKKVRGQKKAQTVLLEAIKKDLEGQFSGENVVIQTAYAGDDETGERWNQTVREYFPERTVESHVLPLSISCHTGPGTLGIVCIKTAGNIK